jgi:hypothetical protein
MQMWMTPAPEGDRTPVVVTPSMAVALVITVTVTIVLGISPGWAGRFGEISVFATLGG